MSQIIKFKKLILLSGKSNTGKTSILRELFDKSKIVINLNPKNRIERIGICKIKNKNVAIISDGDAISVVKKRFNQLVKYKCKIDVVIIACHPPFSNESIDIYNMEYAFLAPKFGKYNGRASDDTKVLKTIKALI